MIRLSTRSRFEAACMGNQPSKVIEYSDLELPYDWPYYEIEGKGWLLNLPSLNVVLLFGPEDTEIGKLDFSDWELIQLSNQPSKKYILNIMKAHCHLDYEFYKVVGTGSYLLRNNRTGEEIDFSIKTCGSSYYKSTAIGYPEKLEIPINKSVILEKDKLISTLCNGLRPNIT